MSLKTIRRVVSRIFKVGKSRVKIVNEVEASQALTADDVRELLKKKSIEIKPKKGVSRTKVNKRKKRKRGAGSIKGRKRTRAFRKESWIKKIRAQRKYLKGIKNKLKNGAYRSLYLMIKGNNFKTKKALKNYIEEHELLE